MADTITIDPRFRGPPTSANGGYTCGMLAEALGTDAAEVSLRLPPPLGEPLVVERDGAAARLTSGERIVAEGHRLDGLDVDPPMPPPLAEAEAARDRYPYFHDHTFPECFVCGPDRAEGDGLRIHPGPLDGRSVMSCDWTPEAEFADAGGVVDPVIVWAALDCPTGLAAHHFEAPEGTQLAVLARLRARRIAPVRAAEPHVVVGWPAGSEGRKRFARSAIYNAAGELCAYADALWIQPRSDP
jgi:hypothetical protein